MNKTNELKDIINKTDIPQLLRDYLLRNEQIQLILSTDLLKDIEDLYIEYDSLYIFDEAEFCSHVITGLKRQDKHEYFYNYLKIVIGAEVQTISKQTTHDQLVLERMAKNIKPKIDELPNYIFILRDSIDDYKKTKDTSLLVIANRIAGMLEVIYDIFPGNPYADAYKKSKDRLDNLPYSTQESEE